MARCRQHDCHLETVDAGSALSIGDRSNNAFKRTRGDRARASSMSSCPHHCCSSVTATSSKLALVQCVTTPT